MLNKRSDNEIEKTNDNDDNLKKIKYKMNEPEILGEKHDDSANEFTEMDVGKGSKEINKKIDFKN
jgi:hypothetical protein